MKQSLVTVAVITFNRKSFLRKMLVSSIKQIRAFNLYEEVNVIICDNCSTDGTDDLVKQFIIDNSDIDIIYNRNVENIGIVRNIITSLDNSNGVYWMLYGDDDEIANDGLLQIVNKLKNNRNKAAFLFKCVQTNFVPLGIEKEMSIVEAAENCFYNFGNAGVFAINTEYAKKAVQSHYKTIVSTCWPQTEIGFRAMSYSQKAKPLLVCGIESSSSPNHESNSSYNSWYIFETTYFALLRVALNMSDFFGQSFIHHAAKGMPKTATYKLIGACILYPAFFDSKEESLKCEESINQAIKTLPSPYKLQSRMSKITLKYVPKGIKKLIVLLFYFISNPFLFKKNYSDLIKKSNKVFALKNSKINFSTQSAMYGDSDI